MTAEASAEDVTLRDAEEDPELSWPVVGRRLASPVARRGCVALAAGVTVLVWPRATVTVLTAVVGVGLVLAGVSDVVAAVRRRQGLSRVARAALTVLGGAALLVATVSGSGVVGHVVGGLLVAWGLLDVAVVIRRAASGDCWWRLVRATGSIVLGVAVVVAPEAVVVSVLAAIAVVWVVAAVVSVLTAVDTDDAGATDSLATTMAWLRRQDMGPEGRRDVTSKLVAEGPALRRHVSRFVVLMLFATVIATLGVQTDSTAVVIGAMLIAPLMTPILAISASLLMGWPVRALRSLGLAALGVALAVAASWLLARYAPSLVAIDSNSQVLSRTSPTLLDLAIAVAAGGAGAYAVSRADVADSLPGVAVAVALVPPLSVVGVSLDAGAWSFAAGAFLLFLTNFVGVLLSAGIVFVLVGLVPWFRLKADRTRLVRTAVTVGVGLLLVALPLAATGEELTRAAADESTVESTVEEWLGAGTTFSVAQISIGGESVDVVVVGGGEPPPAAHLAQLLAARLDRPVVVDLRVVPEERTVVEADPDS